MMEFIYGIAGLIIGVFIGYEIGIVKGFTDGYEVGQKTKNNLQYGTIYSQ